MDSSVRSSDPIGTERSGDDACTDRARRSALYCRRQHLADADPPARNLRSVVDLRRSASFDRASAGAAQVGGSSCREGSDVYLFLIGMMLLSELAREQGVFDWVASVCGARGKWQLFASFPVGLWCGHASDDLHVERCDSSRVDTGNSHRCTKGKGLAASIPVRVCSDRERRELRVADLKPCKSGRFPYRDATTGDVARRLRRAVTCYPSWRPFSSCVSYFATNSARASSARVEDTKLSGNGKLVLAGLALMIVVLLTASAMKKDLGLPTCLAALVITAIVSIKAEEQSRSSFSVKSAGRHCCWSQDCLSWSMLSRARER